MKSIHSHSIYSMTILHFCSNKTKLDREEDFVQNVLRVIDVGISSTYKPK